MSFISDTVNLIATLPLNDISRARLELAMDQYAIAERKASDLMGQVAKLEVEKERLQAELEASRREQRQDQEKHRALEQKHAEQVRIAAGVEFRCGLRTGGLWLPFCPVCQLPVVIHRGANGRAALCSDSGCRWMCVTGAEAIEALSASLAAATADVSV